MPVLSLLSARSLANTATKRVFGSFPFSAANISGSATQGQLGGVLYRPGAVSSTWSFDSGNVILSATGIPYHSYYNSAGANVPSAQNYSSTWTYRGGLNVAGSGSSVGVSPIGYLLNGVAIYSANAGSATPAGYSAVSGYNYNLAYESSTDLDYTFYQDLAGGYTLASGAYTYRDYSFAQPWATGAARVGTANSGATGLAESSVIPYLESGLFHADGHSKILGIAADGYPIYGPYGYSDPNDSESGSRRLLSGYSIRRRDTRTGDATNVSTYPMGIFTQDYSYTGNSVESLNINVVNSGSSAYTMTQVRETKNVSQSISLGNNPNFVVSAGSVLTFNVSAVGHPFWIKTTSTVGTSNGVTVGEIVNNGSSSASVYWHTAGVASGTYYYICQFHSLMQGTITVTSATPADLDTNNGRYCVTPDYPGGTYAYFMTVDDFNGAIYPYIIGNTYYGDPATL